MRIIFKRFISALLVLGICIANFMYVSVSVSAVPEQSANYAGDELIVKLKPGASINSVLDKHGGGQVNRTIQKLGVHKIKVPKNSKLQTLISEIKSDPAVEYCQLNYEYKANYVPNDPAYSQQWGLTRINADKAWDVSTGNNSITIAVVDTGVDSGHQDLVSNLISGYNTITNTANTNDDNGHGTHVAGIAAGVIDNAKGIAGVSGKSKIMPIKVLDSNGSGWTTDITEGVIWAADHGAKVINMSLGGSSYDQAFQDAVNYAYNKGVLVVAAAGNSNTSAPSYPAAFNNVMAVSAVDQNNERASFSNYGTYIDITAPGVGIYSTTYNNSYVTMSGTSMASPFIAGAAALMRSQNNNLTPSQVESVLESTATDLGFIGKDANFGYGLVNLYKAIISIPSEQPSASPDPTLVNYPTGVPSQTPTPTVAPSLVPQGSIENPADSETISGIYTVKGWFQDGDIVSKIEVLVDDVTAGEAVYGDLREDIASKYPAYNNSNSGFRYSLDTTKYTAGSHTLTVRETSKTGSQTTLPKLTVNITNKPRAANINYFLSEDSTVTIDILNSSEKVVRNLENGTPKFSGWNSAKWDGRDSMGFIVPDGVYTYRITAVDAVGHSTTTKGTIRIERLNPSITSVSDNPDPFIPDGTDVNTISFTLSEDAIVSIKIFSNNGNLVKNLTDKAYKTGANTVTWDGIGNDGSVVPNGKYSYAIDAFDAVKKPARQVTGSIVVGATSLVISDNTVSPNPFAPTGSNSTTIFYNLSESGQISIAVLDGSDNLVRSLESSAEKAQGNNSIAWDGKDSSGIIVSDGAYGYRITAIDEGGLEASPATGIINIEGAQENPLISSVDDTPDPLKPDGTNFSTISFNLFEKASVRVKLYNSNGSMIKSIPAGTFEAGVNSFKWDGKDDAGKTAATGKYTYIIDASAADSSKIQKVTGTITVDSVVPVISEADISPDPFEPVDGNMATISYKISEDAKVSVAIYDGSNNLVSTIEEKDDKLQGSNSASWDGTGTTGNMVVDGIYTYLITAEDYAGQEAVPVKGIFTVAGQNKPLLTDVNDSPDPFKPDTDGKNSINFSLSEEANVVINISDSKGGFVKNLLNDIAGSGNNTVIWDGSDNGGKIVESGTYTYTIEAVSSNNDKNQVVSGIIKVDVALLAITGNSADPNPFIPSGTNITTISYRVSDEAKVTVKVYDSLNNLVKSLEENILKSSGSNSVSWDGRNADGTVVPQGNYKYIISAVDSSGMEAKPVSGIITVLEETNNKSLLISEVSDTPDPFKPDGKNSSTISYIISDDAVAAVELYNSKGDMVRTLFNSSVKAGNNRAVWDGKDSQGKLVDNGTFTYKINAQDTNGSKAPQVSGTISVDKTAPVITLIGVSPDPFTIDGTNNEEIFYSLSENAAVTVTVLDSLNKVIRVLDYEAENGKGANVSRWDGKNINGDMVSAGTYYVKIEAVNSAGLSAKPVIGTITAKKAPGDGGVLLDSLKAYPDPFKPGGNSLATIEYNLLADANVVVGIYDSKNELVKTLWNDSTEKGTKTLTWDGKNSSGALVGKGVYSYKISAADSQNQNKAQGTGTITVEYDLPNIIVNSISPAPFESSGSNLATISYILSKEANVTTEIFDSSETLVGKLESGVDKLSGVTSAAWDGKDLSGQPVKDGTYTVKITAVDFLNQTVIATGTIIIKHTAPEILSVKDGPDPFKPGVVSNKIEFMLTKDAKVSVKILDISKSIIRTLANIEMKAGTNSTAWDGKGADGSFVSSGMYGYTIDAVDVLGNRAAQAMGTITVDTAPAVISDARVNRIPFTPDGSNAVTVLYNLSEDAKVTLSIFDSKGSLARSSISDQLSKAGLNWTEWNGRDSEGNLAAAGTYTYKIEAVDAAQNTSRSVSGRIIVEAYNNTAPINTIDFEDDTYVNANAVDNPVDGSNITWNTDYGTEPEEVTAHREWLNRKGIDIYGTPNGFVWSTKATGTAGTTGSMIGFASPNHIEQDSGLSDSEVLLVDLLNDPADMVEVELSVIPSSDATVDNIPANVVIKAYDADETLVTEKNQNFMGVTHGSLTPARVKLVSASKDIAKITLEATETPVGGVFIESISYSSDYNNNNEEPGDVSNPGEPTVPAPTKLEFTGKWKITVTSKEAGWNQRVRIAESAGGDGTYDGIVGNSFIIDGDTPWLLSVEHNGGPGWEESLIKTANPVTSPTQYKLDVLSEDNIYYPDDYNDLVLNAEKILPIPAPIVTPAPVPSEPPTDSVSPSATPVATPTPTTFVVDGDKVNPNPFAPEPSENSTTTIYFNISKDAKVTVSIFDKWGALVKVLANSVFYKAGANSVTWDGRNTLNKIVKDGAYSYKIDAVDESAHAKSVTGVFTVDGNPVITSVNDTPDPFAPTGRNYSTIKFTLATDVDVNLRILDENQSMVRILDPSSIKKGSNTVLWDGKDSSGKIVPSGKYTYVISAVNTSRKIDCQIMGTITVKNDTVTPIVPENPTDPTSPTNPADPTNPTEPTSPTDPTEPTVPVTPVIPVISEVSDSPDPFGPDCIDICTIKYTLSKDAQVTVKIYDSRDNLVGTLIDSAVTAGTKSVSWDGRNDSGSVVADGIYIYRIDAVDSSGNKAVQAAGSITVDSSYPTIDPVNVDPPIFEPIE